MAAPARVPGPRELRGVGTALLLAGLLPLAGVLDPDMWKTFGGTDEQAVRAVAAHPVSTQVAGFLIGAGFALAIPAVSGLARIVGTPAARLAAPLFVAGVGLTLADIAFGLKVTHGLATSSPEAPLPSWYAPLNDWGSAMFTAGTGLLGGAALLVLGVDVVRYRTVGRWSGWITVVAATAMLGQVAAFGGLLPFPQFLALGTLGAATLLRHREAHRHGTVT